MNDDIKITTESVNDHEIIRPCVDDHGICFTDDHVKISECVIDEKGDIRGFTDDHVKALYKYNDHKWYFGSEISKLNLINLSLRTKEERQMIGSMGAKKRDENREAKKNINELAKAMLEQTVTEKQIKSVLGDDTTMLLDNSVASVMLGAMIKSALNGSFKAFEAVRDTAGYKPKNEIELNADIMTDNDKALIDKALKNA